MRHPILLCAFFVFCGSALEARTVSVPNFGVTFQIPKYATVEQDSQSAAIFFPGSGGFSPNIGIFRHDATKIRTYAQALIPVLRGSGYVILSSIFVGPNEWRLRYAIPGQPQSGQAYARATRTQRGVILLTATTLDSQWAWRSPELVRIVNKAKIKP